MDYGANGDERLQKRKCACPVSWRTDAKVVDFCAALSPVQLRNDVDWD